MGLIGRIKGWLIAAAAGVLAMIFGVWYYDSKRRSAIRKYEKLAEKKLGAELAQKARKEASYDAAVELDKLRREMSDYENEAVAAGLRAGDRRARIDKLLGRATEDSDGGDGRAD